MSKRKPLSKAEMEIARIVWDLKSATVREVHDAVPAGRALDFTTVQTYLSRLADKGYLKFKIEGRSRVYSAKVNSSRVISDTVQDFVGHLFGGEPLPLIRHLLSGSDISPDQMAELRKMLLDAEEQSDG